MKLEQITPVILTFNEQENIARALDALTDFPRIVVLDSGSSDDTQRIVAGYRNVVLAERAFDNHSNQWNHALSLAGSDWVLSLDADYVCPPPLIDELHALIESDQDVFSVGFRFCVHGKPLRRALLPPRPVLFRRSRCHYVQDGHTQVLSHQQPARLLATAVLHDDRKPLSRWLWAQIRYAELEADKLCTRSSAELDLPDRLRRWLIVMPWLTPMYVLFGKGLILDGWRGWHYAVSRCLAETMLALMLIDRRLHNRE